MPCCKCNRTGTCKGCTCARGKSACVSCLPGKLGKCINPENSSSNQAGQSSSTPTSSVCQPSSDPPRNIQHLDAEANLPNLPNLPNQQLQNHPDSGEQVQDPLSLDTWSLPEPTPPADPIFSWGHRDGQSFISEISATYDEVVHWRANLFAVPFGKAGKHFVSELARLYRAFADASALESIAIKASCVLSVLALQRPYKNSKAKVHSHLLARRLETWLNGDVNDLLNEGRTIQAQCFKHLSLSYSRKSPSHTDSARQFAKMMCQGKCGAALSKLTEEKSSGVLGPNTVLPSGESVADALKSKHPVAQGQNMEALPPSDRVPPPQPNTIMFDCIDAVLIRQAARNTNGAAGPSGLDSHSWRRICCTFKEASDEICNSLALLARRLCTQCVDSASLAPLLACRLIALDKNPGVRPIGICEVPRRIISKAILSVIKCDIQEAAGATQLCGGQVAGIESAVHAVRELYSSENTEGILLVDASNAFNSLNRANALANIRHLCPPFFTILANIYRSSSDLYLGDTTLLSQEGTTQGDPLAMPFYVLATRPLMNSLSKKSPNVKQIWYADDATASGKIEDLRSWWSHISTLGPAYGYFVNPSKTWLVTKEGSSALATENFGNTNVKITTEGRPVLGSPIGSPEFISNHVQDKVQEWVAELDKLSTYAESHPHAAYASLTHGLYSKWNYMARTTPSIEQELQPLEDAIRTKILPKLTGREPPNNTERCLFSLPARTGGLNLIDPASFSNTQYQDSIKITAPLTKLILDQSQDYPLHTLQQQLDAKNAVKYSRRKLSEQAAAELKHALPPSLQKSMELSSEKGASNWLTVLPLVEHHFTLHKQAFRDALALRYGWSPSLIPSSCSCGTSFSVEHALSCPKGGYPSIRHNELRDFTASLLSETSHGVAIEPTLQPITSESFRHATANTQEGARLDIVANGFWGGPFERAFFDVRVFNPLAQSNRHQSLAASYRQHEKTKKRHYEQRIREVEHSSFTPLVFSTTGGLGPATNSFYKRLASMLADKWQQSYSSTIGWLRCRISFCLLRSSIMCIRGARSSVHRFDNQASAAIDLALAESKLIC